MITSTLTPAKPSSTMEIHPPQTLHQSTQQQIRRKPTPKPMSTHRKSQKKKKKITPKPTPQQIDANPKQPWAHLDQLKSKTNRNHREPIATKPKSTMSQPRAQSQIATNPEQPFTTAITDPTTKPTAITSPTTKPTTSLTPHSPPITTQGPLVPMLVVWCDWERGSGLG